MIQLMIVPHMKVMELRIKLQVTFPHPHLLKMINIRLIVTTTVLGIIQHPVFYLKHNVSETGFCVCLQVEPTQLAQ
jgi:hypothetical protein